MRRRLRGPHRFNASGYLPRLRAAIRSPDEALVSGTAGSQVLVLGSVVYDRIARVPRLPRAGESLTGTDYYEACGGKGANQAVAAKRMGAAVTFIGCVGDDNAGATQRQALAAEVISVKALRTVRDAATGGALILVTDSGENQIAMVPGANLCVGEPELQALETALPEAGVLLLQLEIPMAVNIRAAELAWRSGVPVVLDPAPAQELPHALLANCAVLTPNATEAEALTGRSIRHATDAQAVIHDLMRRGARQCIVKLDARGGWANLAPRDDSGAMDGAFAAIPVDVVDPVAAGDAFNGALAAALCEHCTNEQALDWARAAGALAVTRKGAQPSLPHRTEVLVLLAWHASRRRNL
jgi:ribokinase